MTINASIWTGRVNSFKLENQFKTV